MGEFDSVGSAVNHRVIDRAAVLSRWIHAILSTAALAYGAILPRVFFIFPDSPVPPSRPFSARRRLLSIRVDPIARWSFFVVAGQGDISCAPAISRVYGCAWAPKRRLNYQPLLFILRHSADAPVPRPGHLVHARHPHSAFTHTSRPWWWCTHQFSSSPRSADVPRRLMKSFRDGPRKLSSVWRSGGGDAMNRCWWYVCPKRGTRKERTFFSLDKVR